jgi:transcriptional regulator with XRE-family HTH domain
MVEAQERARELRAEAWTLADIAAELGVSKSSVSVWVRDVAFTPNPRRAGRRREPNALQRRKATEIAELADEGRRRIGELSDRDLLVVGTALYAGEGSKRDGEISFANSDPRMVGLFLTWLRRFFPIDERRLRVALYLHQGLDLDAAVRFWEEVTGIPSVQFRKPYRAAADPTMRRNKHPMGCVGVSYGSSRAHRGVIGLVDALLSCPSHSGVAQLAEHRTVNAIVVGSSPTPGALTPRARPAGASSRRPDHPGSPP